MLPARAASETSGTRVDVRGSRLLEALLGVAIGSDLHFHTVGVTPSVLSWWRVYNTKLTIIRNHQEGCTMQKARGKDPLSSA